MSIKHIIKNILKNTVIYPMYRSCKLRKRLSVDNNISYFDTYKSFRIVDFDLKKILDSTSIIDSGIGHFAYYLDSSIIVNNLGAIIDNIPVDYGYLLNKELGNDFVSVIIKDYIERINDPRILVAKPTDLKSALQAILFWNSLLWQTGHKLVGLGRLDKVLSNYEIPENGEELICDFLKTLHTNYEFKSSALKGDTGQIILLGGLEEDGSYFYNEYTYLFIKCLNKIHLPDPKILLRCSHNTPIDLIELAMDCVSSGIGSPLFSNDDVIIPKLIEFGYEKQDAYNYGVSACWEPLSIGNSLEQNNIANIEFGKCINETILDDGFLVCNDFEDVFDLFKERLSHNCENIKININKIQWENDPLLSFMMGLEKDISKGGAKYNNYGILSVGMSSAVNSLLNIKKYVFEKDEYSLKDIQSIIQNNFVAGISPFDKNHDGFGTEDSKAIELTNRILKETESFFIDYRNKYGGKVKFGLSSPSYIGLSHEVGATLDGRFSGTPFQTHISNDTNKSITQIINFESKLSFTGFSSNANVLDVMIQSTLIKDNVGKFAQYILGGIKQGFFQLQMNVLSYTQLVEAKMHPEKYPSLIVRVWGFSAYFNDLPEEYKDHLIRRARDMENFVNG